MKKDLIYVIFLIPVVFLLWYFRYPEHLGAIEAYSFFAWTSDYLFLQPIHAGRLGELAGDFLSQFYRWREMGALIQALFFLLTGWSTYVILMRLQLQKFRWLSILPPVVLLLLQLRWSIHLAPALQFTIFCLSAALYTSIRKIGMRIASLVLLIPLAVAFFPIPTVWGFCGCVITIELVLTWKSQKQAPYTVKNTHTFVRNSIFLGVVFLIAAGVFVTNQQSAKEERRFAVENAAFSGDWNKILVRVSPAEAKSDSLLLRYTLLALSEENILPESLAALSPLPADCFYFYRRSELATQYFNSLFYAGIGLYNESVHQLFEATTATRNGMSFRCLRSLVDWNIRMGNIPLVEKYLTLLEQSNGHGSWIAKRRKRIADTPPVTIPDKSDQDIFIGAYGFIPEMRQLWEADPENKKKTDYLLCSLILSGNTSIFQEVFNESLYRNSERPLPQLYKGMIGTQN